jgi:glycosyltransferase involved in cell wall biosynthesis
VVVGMNLLMFCSTPNVGLSYKFTSLAISLKNEGINVVIITTDKEQIPGLFTSLLQAGVKFYKCEFVDSYSVSSIIKASRIISNIVKKEDIDIIHLQGLLNLPATRLALRMCSNKHIKIPLALTLRSSLILENPLLQPVLKLASNLVDAFITVSDSSRQHLFKLRIPLEKITTVHNAIELSSFDKLFYDNKNEIGIKELIQYNEKNITISYTAILHPWKGHIYFLEAASSILKYFSNVKFIIIGGGLLRKQLESLTAELKISDNVVFTGQVDNYVIPKLLYYTDIGVSSSLKEICPYNVLELMAAKKPVVATNVGGTAELVKHGVNGFIVPPKDSDSLARAVCTLLDDPKKALEMGIKGRQICEENFDMDVIVDKLINKYEHLLRNSKC